MIVSVMGVKHHIALWQLMWFDDDKKKFGLMFSLLWIEAGFKSLWDQAHVNQEVIRPGADHKLDSCALCKAWSLLVVDKHDDEKKKLACMSFPPLAQQALAHEVW